MRSSVGLEGERKVARVTPPPQTKQVDVLAANAAVAREPAPQHAQSSASFTGNGLVEQDESGSQQPDEDLISDADDVDKVSVEGFV